MASQGCDTILPFTRVKKRQQADGSLSAQPELVQLEELELQENRLQVAAAERARDEYCELLCRRQTLPESLPFIGRIAYRLRMRALGGDDQIELHLHFLNQELLRCQRNLIRGTSSGEVVAARAKLQLYTFEGSNWSPRTLPSRNNRRR